MTAPSRELDTGSPLGGTPVCGGYQANVMGGGVLTKGP